MSMKQVASFNVLRTIVPVLLAVGLIGVLPNWVTLAEAEGYAPGTPQAGIESNANILTTALASKGAISSVIGSRTGASSRSTAGGFRIDGLRLGNAQFGEGSLLSEDSAAGESATGQLGGFLTAVGGMGEQEGVFDYSLGGLVGGIDYQFSDEVIGGLAINWISVDTDDTVGGGSDRDSYGASLYAGYTVDRWNISGLFNYSFSDYANTRVNGADVTVGANNSDELFLSAGVSYECDMMGWTVGPAARVGLVKVWMDGYSETGTGAVSYDAFDVTSFTTDLGVDASYAIKTDAGTITPRVHAYWVHEYQNDAQSLTGTSVTGMTSTPFSVLTGSPDRNYMRLGAGATMELQDGLQIYVDYEGLAGFDDITSHSFSAGGRFEF